MSDRTFEDGWRAACESLAATYTDVARDSIALERRENFSNAAAAARFRANEPDTPAPSDAARTETLLDTIYKHDRTKTYEYGEPLRNGTKPGPGQRFLTPRELIEVHRVELARASPPPMETAAVEELASSVEVVLNDFFGGNRDEERDTRPLGVQIRDAIRAALTRLRATTTARDAELDGDA